MLDADDPDALAHVSAQNFQCDRYLVVCNRESYALPTSDDVQAVN
jgi:hypothetical protein